MGPATQQDIDAAVRRIVMDAFDQTTALLSQHRDTLEACARELLSRETLDETALTALTAGLQKASDPTAPAAQPG